MLHDEEHPPDHVVVLAKGKRPGNGYVGPSECGQDRELPIYRMGGRQDRTPWLRTKHISPGGRRDEVGGIGLAPGKPTHLKRAAKSVDLRMHPAVERRAPLRCFQQVHADPPEA